MSTWHTELRKHWVESTTAFNCHHGGSLSCVNWWNGHSPRAFALGIWITGWILRSDLCKNFLRLDTHLDDKQRNHLLPSNNPRQQQSLCTMIEPVSQTTPSMSKWRHTCTRTWYLWSTVFRCLSIVSNYNNDIWLRGFHYVRWERII